jgi:hypothetical protein
MDNGNISKAVLESLGQFSLFRVSATSRCRIGAVCGGYRDWNATAIGELPSPEL